MSEMIAPPLRLRGHLVAAFEPRPASLSWRTWDQLFVYRGADDWTLLTIRSRTSSDDGDPDHPDDITVWDETFPTLDALEKEIRSRGYPDGWTTLLDKGHADDPDLHRRWAPIQIDRDVDNGVSIHDRELGAGGGGRQREDWKERAVARVIARLEERHQYVVEARDVGPTGPVPGDWSAGNPVIGTLRARRYHHRFTLVVMVDSAGEVYARLPEPDEVPLEELSDDEIEVVPAVRG